MQTGKGFPPGCSRVGPWPTEAGWDRPQPKGYEYEQT
jgi:hypothetical protein